MKGYCRFCLKIYASLESVYAHCKLGKCKALNIHLDSRKLDFDQFQLLVKAEFEAPAYFEVNRPEEIEMDLVKSADNLNLNYSPPADKQSLIFTVRQGMLAVWRRSEVNSSELIKLQAASLLELKRH